MTDRLYYQNSDLGEFEAAVAAVLDPVAPDERFRLVLNRSAFYPTSGGQVYDTGWLISKDNERSRVSEVAETDDGKVVHYLEAPVRLKVGDSVRGCIDRERRRDHMQQHSGQHVLSAAFLELYQMPTVSFHMGDDYCSIDLTANSIRPEQVSGAEKRANQIIFENRPVGIRFSSRREAETLGLRKLPPAERDPLRLIEIADYDLSACGGTHVSATGQIGAILLRKTEKTRQGVRVEFVCGGRAVTAARRDHSALTEAAGLFSAQLWDVPTQVRKAFEEVKLARKQKDDALEQLADAMARVALGEQAELNGRKVIVRSFADRDIGFVKLFAQKLIRTGAPVIALVASALEPPGIVFAQSAGGNADMGLVLKQVLSSVGGRGGGSRDFAQGGVPQGNDVEKLLRLAASTIGA